MSRLNSRIRWPLLVNLSGFGLIPAELHVLPKEPVARENLELLDVNPIGEKISLAGDAAELLR